MVVSTILLKDINEKRSYLKNLIEGQGTKKFGITFRKKDGQLRVMSAQKGVSKFVKGVGSRVLGPHEDVVFDSNAQSRNREVKGDYRTVNLDTTYRLKTQGVVRDFIHNSDGTIRVDIIKT